MYKFDYNTGAELGKISFKIYLSFRIYQLGQK